MTSHGTTFRFILMLTLLATVIGCGGAETPEPETFSLDSATEHKDHDHAPGDQPTSEAIDWCREHSVPESVCTQCDSTLIAGFKATGDWCGGHGLPESHCRLCNPQIRFPQEERLRELALAESDGDIAVSLLFRPNSSVCATNDALIQFASETTAERAGLSVHQVRSQSVASAIEAPAELVFDESASTVVSTTIPVLVSRWLVSPGDPISEGDVMAVVQSPAMADLQADLLSAFAADKVQQKEVARLEALKARDLVSEADYEREVAHGERTRAEYIALRGLLKSAGLSEGDLSEILAHRKISNHFALRAPSDGVLVERKARVGDLLAAGEALALLADPAAMWIEARVSGVQLRQIERGQELTFSSDGRGLSRVGGRVIWVSRYLDPHTRTGTVRAEVVDRSHYLNAGEFGRVSIAGSQNDHVILVPKDAVQWEGCCNVVFVRETDYRYRPRKIEFHDGAGPYYRVTDGLRAGEDVVVNGAFLLKTELKKSSIGAGCCGIEPVG
ncbi:MAG: efflux RND transporter periplasmic adaptor subunit [candidate division Zixibacteria bacterium]|nr:efflux RND transporter periplasmic adaptor subunit [candidate division Zixibacteria bacterium]